MTDRELLEMAAKAAGIRFNNKRSVTGSISLYCAENGWWNPLTDDGDALRLAVKLRIEVNFTDEDVEAIAYAHAVGDNPAPWAIEVMGKSPGAATRRAIVRAAAEIGKGMA